MRLELLPLDMEKELPRFKKDMQEAFLQGAVAEFGNVTQDVLPERDIDSSLGMPGAAAYKAVSDGETVGGAVVVIDEKTNRNHLDLLYVKPGFQSGGIGFAIWSEIEKFYPNTAVWETFTPYFEKRNIHFYINRCGFRAVEFFNPKHKDPRMSEDIVGGDYFFRFEKVMK